MQNFFFETQHPRGEISRCATAIFNFDADFTGVHVTTGILIIIDGIAIQIQVAFGFENCFGF